MLYIYCNSEVFAEIAESLEEAFTALEVPNKLVDDLDPKLLTDDNLFIMLGLNTPLPRLPPKYIAYQFEQTGNVQSWFSDDYLEKLRGAVEIWDYSIKNIQNCKQYQNLPLTRYVPVCYSSCLTRIKQPDERNKRYDVLFYGSACPRRDEMIRRLRQAGLRVYYSTYKCWDEERDQMIQESKIVLNVHFYPKPILETPRLSYLIANGAFTISEPSLDPLLDMEYKNYVIFADYDSIPEMCQYWLDRPDERREHVMKAFDRFKKKKYAQIIPTQAITGKPNHLSESITKPVIESEPDQPVSPSVTSEPLVVPSTKKPLTKPSANFQEAEVQVTAEGAILTLSRSQLTDNSAPKVTLITPTAKRSWVLGLAMRNFYSFTYPRDKLEWIILDSEPTEPVFMPSDPRIKYEVVDPSMELWEKRNLAVQKATGDIIVHLDDDDYYFPESVWTKVKLLDQYKCGAVGNTTLGVYHLIDNYSYQAETRFLSEASMAYTKAFWEERPFSGEELEWGEGYSFLKGREDQVRVFPFYFNFIALTHFQNYTGALRTHRDNHEQYDNYFNLWDTTTKQFFIELRLKALRAQKQKTESRAQLSNPF